jgi:hypothetical protein
LGESSENDPEQLIHTSENSPALSLSETDSGPVESESSQTGATKSDLEPSVSTTDTQQNIEHPSPVAKYQSSSKSRGCRKKVPIYDYG